MKDVSGNRTGTIKGTNNADIFVEIQQSEQRLSSTIRINDPVYGTAVYYCKGSVNKTEILLEGEPSPEYKNILEVDLGRISIKGTLNSDGSIFGTWTSTIGTGGTFSIFLEPQQINVEDNFEKSLEKVLNLDVDDYQKKVDFVRKIDIEKTIVTLENAGKTNSEMYKSLSKLKDVNFDNYQKSLDSVKKMELGLTNNNAKIDTQKKSIFISYSHEDAKHLKRLKVHIKPLEKQGLVELWDDTKIKTGDKWREEITSALDKSTIAILIISADFLASDFIIENELPPILEKANSNGTQILPIILKPSRFGREEKLSQYQALNKPENPVLNMTEHEQELLWDKLAERIEELL